MNVTGYQTDLAGASYIDTNTGYTVNGLPDRVPDELSVALSGLVNLFNCPIGARGRIMEPTYGSIWWELLQEPLDDITAGKIQTAMIQAINIWEPRVILDMSGTSVVADPQAPGYDVTIAYFFNINGNREVTKFMIPVSQMTAMKKRI